MKKKNIRQIFPIAAVILLSSGVTVSPVSVSASSAAPLPGISGEQTDVPGTQKTIAVTGITPEHGITVTAFQIVDGCYKNGKLVKYVLMDRISGSISGIGNETKGGSPSLNDMITPGEITKIADNIETGVFTADSGTLMKVSPDGTVYTADVEPGLYLIIVSGANDTVYNPAVAAVNISDANNPSGADGSTVDMTDFFRYADGTDTRAVYVKSSMYEKDMNKTITGSVKNTDKALGDETQTMLTPDGRYGDTAAVGDTLYFRIDHVILPAFSDDYESPEFIISDHLENTFCPVSDIRVFIDYGDGKGEQLLEEGKDVYSIRKNEDGPGFTIDFSGVFLKNHTADAVSGKPRRPEIIVTYCSSLLDTADMNFSENLNRATLKYSNNPNDRTSYRIENRNTYHYTFSIGGIIDAENEKNGITDKKTIEDPIFNKVSNISDTLESGVSTRDPMADTRISSYALEGAVFGLYSSDAVMDTDDSGSKALQQSVSDKNGHICFSGLDRGTYFIREIRAPEGYSLNDEEYVVTINALLDDKGILTEYTETVRKAAGLHAAGALDKEDPADTQEVTELHFTTAGSVIRFDGEVVHLGVSYAGTPVQIKDTKIQKLPSTGGAGLLGILFSSCILGFTGLHVGKKRRK